MKNRLDFKFSRYLCLKRIVAVAVCFVTLAAVFCFQTEAMGGNGLIEGQISGVNQGNSNGHWKGQIERITPTTISGWAWRKGSNTYNQVQIFLYDECCGNHNFNAIGIYANIYRTDLANAGIGNGDRGFSWNWDPNGTKAGHRIKFRVVMVDGSSHHWFPQEPISDERLFYWPNKYKLTVNIGNIGYNIDSSVPSAEAGNIRTAASRWTNTSGTLNTNVKLKEEDYMYSEFDFYSYNGYLDGLKGAASAAYFYVIGGGRVQNTNMNSSGFGNPTANYNWVKIGYSIPVCNGITASTASNYGFSSVSNMKTAIFTHEVGHGLGLAHSPPDSFPFLSDRIMSPMGTNRSFGYGVGFPSWLDLRSINLLY